MKEGEDGQYTLYKNWTKKPVENVVRRGKEKMRENDGGDESN
jgi:hypothetical protein